MPTIPQYPPDTSPDGSELLPAWKNGAQVSVSLAAIVAMLQAIDPAGESASAMISAISAATSASNAAADVTAANAALSAIQSAIASGAIKTYASTANALSNGVSFTFAAGSGATTDGDYALTISGGGGGAGAAGYAVVSGGKIIDVKRQSPGYGYTAIPTASFTIAGLVGGSVTCSIGANTVDGDYFAVPNTASGTLAIYKNVAGVATLVWTWGSLSIASLLDGSRTIAQVKDGAGSVLTGTHMDGRAIKSRSLRRPRLETIVDGNGYRQIQVSDRYGRSLLTSGRYNSWAAEWVRGDTIYFTSDRRGNPEPYSMSADGSNPSPLTVIWEHWQAGGQSWALGTNGAASGSVALALTTTNATPNAYMLTTNAGVAPYGPRPMMDDTNGVANADRFVQPANVTGLETLKEAVSGFTTGGANGETVCSGFAAQYMLGKDSTQRIVMDVWARGSAPWKQPTGSSFPNVELAPRSFHFANKCTHQSLARKYVEAAGGDYVYRGEIVLHGQADATNLSGSGAPTSQAAYTQFLSDWANANNRHSRSRSRYHRTRRLYVLQNSVMTSGLPGAFGIACAQQQAAQTNPLVICFGPSYQCTFNTTDNLHPNAADIRRYAGEQAGKWARRIESGAYPSPMFFPTKAVVSGSVVTCSYVDANGKSLLPWGLSIVLDAGVNVASIANSGVKYYDSGASGITVSSVAVSSDGKSLIVTLSGAPNLANSPYLTFGDASTGDNAHAGKTLGARTNIRNAETELGVLSGLPLYDWHLQGQISVTAS